MVPILIVRAKRSILLPLVRPPTGPLILVEGISS